MPALITGLSATLIDPRLFPTRRWYYASPLWYYHAPRDSTRVRAGGRFYGLIDPDLREACALLLDRGIRTTPSCQGHFYPREWFEEIWSDVTREERAVHGPGLVVADSETETRYLFRDPEYALPWRAFDAFYAEIDPTQRRGYLGFVVPCERTWLIRELERAPYREGCARLERDREVEPAMDGALFMLNVDARSIAERHAAWSCATSFLDDVLRREPESVSVRAGDRVR